MMQLTGASLDYVNPSENVHDFIRSLFFSRLAFLFCSISCLVFHFLFLQCLQTEIYLPV